MSAPALVEATKDDAARIAELLNAISQALYGESELTEAEAASWFKHERLEVLLAERDGALVGYGDRWREEERDRAWMDVRVLPGEREAGAALIAEFEQRARPDVDPGALAMTFIVSMDDTMRSVVEAAGYSQIRSSFRMTIPLDEAVEPEWPEGFAVGEFDPADEAAVHGAHQESFRDHWEHKDESIEEWRKWLVEGPRHDPTLWFVARDGDEVAGISLCQMHSSGDPEHGFVSVLAVRRPWRRRGLGLALLRHSFVEMKRRGMKRASLGVDAENLTGAVAIYERAGMTVERRSDIYSRPL